MLQKPNISAAVNVLTKLDVRNPPPDYIVSILCSNVELYLLSNPATRGQSFANFIEFKKPHHLSPEFELYYRRVAKAIFNRFAAGLK
jgi:hypothetical protein